MRKVVSIAGWYARGLRLRGCSAAPHGRDGGAFLRSDGIVLRENPESRIGSRITGRNTRIMGPNGPVSASGNGRGAQFATRRIRDFLRQSRVQGPVATRFRCLWWCILRSGKLPEALADRDMNASPDWRERRPARKPVRVLIADDHDIVRRRRSVVESRPGWEVVAEAQDGREALDLVIASKPDIAIVDYSIPIMNGAQLTRHICAEAPGTQVLIFTMHDSDVLIREVLTAGARGFLVKSDADRTLIAALDALARRQPYFTGQINEAMLKLYLSQPGGSETSTLTPREREIVQLIAEGNSSKEASRILNISLKTVETHRSSVMHKLNLSTTAALVRYAVRNKIVEP
ncbi:response regulator [Bosea thiooxidans]